MAEENKAKKELLEVLDSNMIYYEKKGEGDHIRVFDEQKQIYWNIYFPSLKFHRDGKPSTNKGVKAFLTNFELTLVDKNQIAIQIVGDENKIKSRKISDHQLHFSCDQTQSVMIPFNIDFSVTPMANHIDTYGIRELGDGWEVSITGAVIVSSSFKIYISADGSRNWDLSKEMQESGTIEDEVEL